MHELKPQFFSRPEELPANTKQIDSFAGSLEEIFRIQNPKFRPGDENFAKLFEEFSAQQEIQPVWVYYPREKTAIKTVSEDNWLMLRTSRNRNIISEEKQVLYRNSKAAVAGLSVGSSVVASLVQTGGPKVIKIADMDTVEATNLNRLQANILDLGRPKVEVAASRTWQLDPYAELYLFEQGVNENNLEQFLLQPRIDAFIDEMDNIKLKFLARELCKKHGIPVIMATDNGDGVILDVERFDLEPDRELFFGTVSDITPEKFTSLTYPEWLRLATRIVDAKLLSTSMRDSILQIGKTIPAVPQLGASAMVAGASCALAFRKIVTGEPMPSGRYVIDLSRDLDQDYNNEEKVTQRNENLNSFLAHFK